MKLLAIAAIAYVFCLLVVFPGYFHPLYPHHDDFYFPPGLSFDGHTLWEKLQWPRPLGFLAMQALGKLGLQGYLFVLVLITLANAALTIALARRIFGGPISWLFALAYSVLVFAHPDFYVDYTHDAFGTLSYFYLILAMHAWYAHRENGNRRYLAVCALLLLAIAFTKETYFLSALVFLAAQVYLCRGVQRRAGAVLLAAWLVFFAAGLGANAYSVSTVLHLKTDASSPYYVSLAPAAVTRGFAFYARRLFHPAALALALAGIAVLYRTREKLIMAGALALAGLSALLPYAVLPNHVDSMYSWTGAMLAFSPVLFLSRPLRPASWRAGAVYAVAGALVIVAVGTSAARYREHRWTIDQEKANRNIMDAYPVMKALDGSVRKILITGLDMPFQPFHTASYIRAEFGPGREWTVVIPRGSAAKFEAPVRLAPPLAIDPHDYDAAFGFDSTGRLEYRWTRAQLQQASAPEQIDRILLPALNPVLDEIAKNPNVWHACLRAGVIYYQWGEMEKAAGLLQRAVALDPSRNPYPVYYLGQVREAQGMMDDARRYYAQAVAWDAGQSNPAFRQALERLRQN